MKDRLTVAVIGMGGFAGEHQRAIRALEGEGECRLVCACDPSPWAFETQIERWEFAQRGVAVYKDYVEMLDAHCGELDIVTIPTPIPLHAPMHKACANRSLACYVEKPPTLDIAELDQMVAADSRATKQTQVGFNFIVEEPRQRLKERILDGEFGAVKRVCFFGFAPRATTYFRRARWAGRLMLDGRLVLDSCIGNALAHSVHNTLFWAGGSELFSWARVASVDAELYRAHDIEGTDTVFARATCQNGVDVWIAATHACEGEQYSRESVECEKATIRWVRGEPFQVCWNDGREETIPLPQRDLLADCFRAYFRYIRGETSRPLTSLTESRPFVALNDLAYVASGRITTVPAEQLSRSAAPDSGEYVAIAAIRAVCERFLDSGAFPSEQGVPWGRRGGHALAGESYRLAGLIKRCESFRGRDPESGMATLGQ